MSGHLPLHHGVYLVVVPEGECAEVGDSRATGLCAVGESRVSGALPTTFLDLKIMAILSGIERFFLGGVFRGR